MALKDIFGQERAKRFLKQLLSLGKLPHAVLFSGMEGIGKVTLAREFAKLLNCLKPQNLDACDACASCVKIKDGHHPDLVWVKSDGAYIKLDQVRSLKQRLSFRPFEGKWRIVIIEDAHDLREEAGNALLKLLEEPPKQNLFILTVLEPQMLLPTIVSRCCHVRLQPLEETWIERYLLETQGLAPPQARKIATMAEGSLDRAKWLADPARIAQINEVLENVSRLKDLSMVDFFALTAQWTKGSADLEQDLECIKLWVRDLALSRLISDHIPMLPADESTVKQARKRSVESLLSLFAEIEKARLLLRQNANKQLTLEGVCLAIKENFYGESCWNPLSQRREDLSF
jgi:DNA polymerase III subunit delta'